MTSITIVRKVDDLGRIVIPIEMRRQLDLECGQEAEMTCQGSTILLRKFLPSCVFCGGREQLVTYQQKHICAACLYKLRAR